MIICITKFNSFIGYTWIKNISYDQGIVFINGEAKDADLGIAGGKGSCLIFKKGEPFKKVAADCAEEEFFKEIRLLLDGE